MTPASIRTHASPGFARGARSSGSTTPAAAASSVRVSSSAPFASAKRHRRATRALASLGAIGGARASAAVTRSPRDPTRFARSPRATTPTTRPRSAPPPAPRASEATGVHPRAIDANDIDYRMMALSVGVGLAVRFACPVPEALTPARVDALRHLRQHGDRPRREARAGGRVGVHGADVYRGDEDADVPGGPRRAHQRGHLAHRRRHVLRARAFIKTGFGDRLGLLFVKAFGHTTLRLAYGLQTAEAALSPAMPPTTARAAGVFVPVINSLDERTRAYLMGQQLQGGTSPLPYFSPRRRRTSCACRSRRRRESCSRTCSRSGSRRLPSRASSPCSSRPLSSTSSIRLY